MDTEDKEAAIIRTVYADAGYSHAERIMHRLEHLTLRLPHREAIDIIHREVVEGEVTEV